MLIVWREQMSVDSGLIDEDHRSLIGIINEFAAAEAGPKAVPALARILTKLDHYTKTHFEREEGLQRAVDYPFRDAHRNAHKDLIRQLSELRARLKAEFAAKNADEIRAIHAGMADFLHHWLIDHIIETDLRMKPYTKDMRTHARKLSGRLGE
jgi:hemerythrin